MIYAKDIEDLVVNNEEFLLTKKSEPKKQNLKK